MDPNSEMPGILFDALARARRRLMFEELFCLNLGLTRIRGRRQGQQAAPFPRQDLGAFTARLPFPLTGAQRRAVEEAENYQGLEIMEVADYPAAVALADSRSAAGDVVILSPASTSFDRFKNFEERGRAFKELVAALPE